MAGPKRVWKIEGYDSDGLIFEDTISVGSLSEREVRTLMTRLAAKHLSHSEIVESSMRRNANRYRPLLEVRRELHPVFTVGENPFFVVRAMDTEEGLS